MGCSLLSVVQYSSKSSSEIWSIRAFWSCCSSLLSSELLRLTEGCQQEAALRQEALEVLNIVGGENVFDELAVTKKLEEGVAREVEFGEYVDAGASKQEGLRC